MNPSPKERVLNLFREAKAWFREGAPLLPEDQAAGRLDACMACDKFAPVFSDPGTNAAAGDERSKKRVFGFCRLCGCAVSLKAWLATARCPDTPPKWDAVTVPRGAWFFESPSRQAALFAELKTWQGTRYFHRAAPAIKGVRADCVSFVERVMVNLGAFKPIHWPSYVTQYGGEPMLDLLLKTLGTIPELERLDKSAELKPGDLVVCSSGKAMHHLAIYAGLNTLWHSLEKQGVCQGNVRDPLFANHHVATFRVL